MGIISLASDGIERASGHFLGQRIRRRLAHHGYRFKRAPHPIEVRRLSIEHSRHSDLIEVLPTRAQGRLRALHQRVDDALALVPSFEAVREANTAKMETANRWQRLVDHPHNSGFGLNENNPRALRAADEADKAAQNAERLQALHRGRLAAWRDTSRILVAVRPG